MKLIRLFSLCLISIFTFGYVGTPAFAATADLTVSPNTVAAGQPVTVAFSNIAPASTSDWIGLYATNDVKNLYKLKLYTNNCLPVSDNRVAARSSGSCQVTIPSGLSPSTYRFRLYYKSDKNVVLSNNQLYITSVSPVNNASLSVSPGSIVAGGTVIAAFSNVALPSGADWIGLFAQGAGNTTSQWVYASSCTKTVGAARPSGSCGSFPIPSNTPLGVYELRLYANGGWTKLTTSNSFTVTVPVALPSLTAAPTSVVAGNSITATFNNVASPTASDWIGLYAQGALDTNYQVHIFDSLYNNTCSPTNTGTPRVAGTCGVTLPANLTPGQYELRLMANNSYAHLATSNAFTVTGATPAKTDSISVSPDSIPAGYPVTVAFNRSTTPTYGMDYVWLFYKDGTAVPGQTFATSNCATYADSSLISKTSGQCTYTVPSSLTGTFGFRYTVYDAQRSNKTYASNTLTVTPAPASTAIYTDPKTGLMWQQADDFVPRTWGGAVAYCGSLALGGMNGWRLPRADELQTIVDYTKIYPSINSGLLASAGDFWTITPNKLTNGGTTDAYTVNFSQGVIGSYTKTYINYVRCLHGEALWPEDTSGRIQIAGPNTLRDTMSGLIWQKKDNGSWISWNDANAYCSNLNSQRLDGYTGWRLPTIQELESITDYGRLPVLNNLFEIHNVEYFWSSTTAISTINPPQDMAWGVDHYYGTVLSLFKNGTGSRTKAAIRCVR